MPRLVDADELWKQMKELHEKRAEEANMTGDRVVCVTWHDAVTLIKNAPTVDAEPVRHGRWIGDICSECGKDALCDCDKYEIYGTMHSDYCPHCGCKMDEAEEAVVTYYADNKLIETIAIDERKEAEDE